MYEPSKELIEQIAKAHWQALRPEQAWGTGGDFEKAFMAVAKETVSCPTIRKALELYENQPQWQDKPDKTGWYCVMAKGILCGWYWLYPPSDAVGVVKLKGAIHLAAEDEDYTLSEFLKRYKDCGGIKFLYLPEPEPYKERE